MSSTGNFSKHSGESLYGSPRTDRPQRPACPVCNGRLEEIRGKLVCSQCHQICETCCEGGQCG